MLLEAGVAGRNDSAGGGGSCDGGCQRIDNGAVVRDRVENLDRERVVVW